MIQQNNEWSNLDMSSELKIPSSLMILMRLTLLKCDLLINEKIIQTLYLCNWGVSILFCSHSWKLYNESFHSGPVSSPLSIAESRNKANYYSEQEKNIKELHPTSDILYTVLHSREISKFAIWLISP